MNARILLLSALCCGLGRLVESAGGQVNRVNSGGVVYAAAPQERGAYAVARAGGPYNYGYNTGDGIAKVEVRQPSGAVVGSYRYFDPNGKQVVRSYIADEKGFRVLGNDLPISPDTPASQVQGTPAFTGAVEGTDEFAIPPPVTSNAQPQSFHVPQQQQPQFQLQVSSQQESALIQEQQRQYQQQQKQLEEQRRQLRLQQEKLEALQRDLEQQQQVFQEQYQKQQVSFQTQQQPLPSRQHYQYQTQNTLSGGYTSPYYYYPQQFDFDFPAGFAYTGLPVIKAPVGAKFVHPEEPSFSAGHTPSRVNVNPPVAPHRQYKDYSNSVTAGHTDSRRGHYVIGLAR